MVGIAESAVGVPAARRGQAWASRKATDAPALPGRPKRTPDEVRREQRMLFFFKQLNRWMTVPLLRAGAGPWIGTPVGGWLLLLRVRGRRTGLVREVPLSYLIDEGAAWVMAGSGPTTQWYRNLLSDPEVEVVLPGGGRRCIAEDVRDPEIRQRIMPRLLRATGAPGFLSGCDPWRASVDEILGVTAWVPLIRLRPVGEPLVAGPDDPGGLGWAWRQLVVLGVTVWSLRSVGRLIRRAVGAS